MSFRRDLAGMSSAKWVIVWGCAFIISMGAGPGRLTAGILHFRTAFT